MVLPIDLNENNVQAILPLLNAYNNLLFYYSDDNIVFNLHILLDISLPTQINSFSINT